MIDKNAFNLEMDNPEDDSTFNNINTSSAQIYGTQLLETSIEDLRNQKKTMVLKIDSLTSLMKEVEYQETAAGQIKMEAAQIYSDIMLKVYELLDMQQHVKEKNDMLSKEACVQKKLLSTNMEALQLHVTSLVDKGDRSLELLDEMSRSLATRLTSAMMKKKLAIKKKKGNEAFARAALAFEERQMEKMEEESKRLKQETVEISKLQEFLIDRGHIVTILHEEISDKCRDVKRLKEELDQVVPPGGKMAFNKKLPISASLSSSLVSPLIPCQPQPGPADSEVPFRKGSGLGIADFIDDHVQSANYKQIKSVIGFSEADIKNSHEVVDVTRSIEKVKTKAKLYGYQMKINGKLCAQMFAKRIKKVKIKGKLHEYQMFAKSIKKVKIKGKHGSQMCAKSSKKSKIKAKHKGSQMCAKSGKKSKIKGKHKGSQTCFMCIKKSKIKDKRKGSQTCFMCIKKSKIKDKRKGSQMCVMCIKKLKIKGKRTGSQMGAKSIKKLKIKGKRKGSQMCARNIKKLKIKGKRKRNQKYAISIKKLKIKGKRKGSQMSPRNIKNFKIRYGSKMCAISIKKLKINSKLHGNQLCPRSIKQVKINSKLQGLQMVKIKKGRAAADQRC